MAEQVMRPRRMNADTFFTLPDDGHRYELIDGELEMAPAPSADVHQGVVARLFYVLYTHVQAHDLGFLRFAPADVVLSAFDVVQSDLFFVAKAREAIVGGRVHGAPDLVVEVTSPSTGEFDRGLKLRRYARFGVSWYWLIDPEEHTLDELELRDGEYVRYTRLRGNEVYAPRLFPGLTIDLEQVWPARSR